KGESELVNHGRSCGRIDGWVGLNCSGPDDYERAFWSRQQCKSLEEARGMFQGCRLGSMQVRKRNPRSKNLQLRNEAALNCVLLRSSAQLREIRAGCQGSR